MTLKDMLKKREKIRDDVKPTHSSLLDHPTPPSDFTFIRSDTNTQEIIQPPSFPSDQLPDSASDAHHTSKHFSRFRSSSNASETSRTSSKGERRLSTRLHIRSHSRNSSSNSVNIPSNLPAINDGGDGSEDKEAKWEERATILAQQNEITRSRSSTLQDTTPKSARTEKALEIDSCNGRPQGPTRNISDAQGDVMLHSPNGKRVCN